LPQERPTMVRQLFTRADSKRSVPVSAGKLRGVRSERFERGKLRLTARKRGGTLQLDRRAIVVVRVHIDHHVAIDVTPDRDTTVVPSKRSRFAFVGLGAVAWVDTVARFGAVVGFGATACLGATAGRCTITRPDTVVRLGCTP